MKAQEQAREEYSQQEKRSKAQEQAIRQANQKMADRLADVRMYSCIDGSRYHCCACMRVHMCVHVCARMHACVYACAANYAHKCSGSLLNYHPSPCPQKEQKERIESSKDKPVPHLDEKLKAQISQAAK